MAPPPDLPTDQVPGSQTDLPRHPGGQSLPSDTGARSSASITTRVRTILPAVAFVAFVLAACGAAAPSWDPGSTGEVSGISSSASSSRGQHLEAPVDTSGVTLKVATYPVAVGSDETLLKAAGLLDTPYTGDVPDLSRRRHPDVSCPPGHGRYQPRQRRGERPARGRQHHAAPNFLSVATLKISPPPSGRSPSPTSRRWPS